MGEHNSSAPTGGTTWLKEHPVFTIIGVGATCLGIGWSACYVAWVQPLNARLTQTEADLQRARQAPVVISPDPVKERLSRQQVCEKITAFDHVFSRDRGLALSVSRWHSALAVVISSLRDYDRSSAKLAAIADAAATRLNNELRMFSASDTNSPASSVAFNDVLVELEDVQAKFCE